MGTATTQMTFEEFERLPDRPGKSELLRGELIELPPAKQQHNDVSQAFFLALLDAVQRLRRERPDFAVGKAHHETGYQLSPCSWLQPDVSLTHPGQPIRDYYQGAPLLAVEVVSESNSAESIECKVREYMTHGAREVWVVYPKTKSVWVFREGKGVAVTGRLETDLLPSFSIDLATVL